MQSCRVQSEGVKNESKGLQETGLPARDIFDLSVLINGRLRYYDSENMSDYGNALIISLHQTENQLLETQLFVF